MANIYKETYENIRFDDTGLIEVRDIDKKILISFYNNRIIVDSEDLNNYSLFQNIATTAIEDYAKVFDVNIFNRIGVRFNYGITFDNYETVNEVLKHTFFKLFDNNTLINVGKVESQQVFMGFDDEGQKYSVGIYPTILNTIEGNPFETKQSNYIFLTFDLDMFIQGKINTQKCLDTLSKGEKFAQTKVKNIIKLMDVTVDGP